MTPMRQGFEGLRVAAFESRLAEAMRRLIVQRGGDPLLAPALREIPLADNHDALRFAERLFAGQVDVLICLTGVGTRTLAAAIATRHPLARFQEALNRITVIVRGPKPAKALTELGVLQFLAVPEPNTWRELLALVDAHAPVCGRQVAVQEYGAPNTELLAGLRDRGAAVTPVPVYRWQLPEDTGPLRQALQAIITGQVDVALFTNAMQVEHLYRVATEEGVADRLSAAWARMVMASIGPVASEALRRHGAPVDLEPSHPKMGILVAEAAQRARRLLAQKRGG